MQNEARAQVPATHAGARKLALMFAALVTALGVGAVAGWLFDVPALRAALPRFVPVRLHGAAALALLGAALALLLAPGRRARRVANGLALAASGLSLGAFATLLGPAHGFAGTPAEAMSGVTALGVLLAAGAVLACDRPARGVPLSASLALALLGWTLLGWLGQRYLIPPGIEAIGSGVGAIGSGAETMSPDPVGIASGIGTTAGGREVPPALLPAHAAIAFVALGVGLLLARPARLPMTAILAPTPGGALLRGLLPAVTLAPTLLAGAMPLALPHDAGRDTGFALVIAGTVTVLAALTWRMAVLLNQFDAQRIRTNRRLARAHRALDRLVARRTDELARSNAALESDRRQLEATLLSIGDAVIALDDAGRITLMNPMAECLTGVAQCDALGRPWNSVVRDHDPDGHVVRALAASIADGWPMSIPSGTRLVGPLGRPVPIDGGAAPVRDAQGRALGAILVLHDVTVQQETLQRIEASESRFRQLFESSPQPILVHDEATLALLDVNAAALDCYGYRREEMLALRMSDLLAPAERARLGREGLPAAALAASRNWRHRRRDGTEIDVQVVTHPQVYAGRQARVMSVTDVTAQTRMAAALRDADRRKDEFLAMLAHELRNPLAPILNASELLRARVDPGPAAGALDMIRRQVRHLTRMVDDLLDVSRITQGRVTLRPARLRLQQVLMHAAETARPLMQARGQRLQLSLAEAPLTLRGDETRLVQAVGNLLANASKFSPPGATVQLSLSREASDGWARIVVEDPGIGIEPGMLTRVFDLFAQADRSLARAQGGLGIGLTLVRRLVELHGGTVDAHSAGLGLGSRFTIRLPLDARAASTETEAVTEAEAEAVAEAETVTEPVAEPVAETVAEAVTEAVPPDGPGCVPASPAHGAEPGPRHRRSDQARPQHGSAPSRLPVGEIAVVAQDDPACMGAHPSLSVLVVDDNVDCADSLALLLRAAGHTVEVVHDGRVALERAGTLRPDALVVDIGLPGMDGYALARALRESPDHRDALLVALTGYGQAADRRRTTRAGFDHHLVKPGEPLQLLRLLDERRAARPDRQPCADGTARD